MAIASGVISVIKCVLLTVLTAHVSITLENVQLVAQVTLFMVCDVIHNVTKTAVMVRAKEKMDTAITVVKMVRSV
jgi:hypothetical protein